MESPAGPKNTTLRLPDQLTDIESVLTGVARSVGGSGGSKARGGSFSESEGEESDGAGWDPAEVGNQLYQALIEKPSGVASLFKDSCTLTRGATLRIRLNLSLEEEGVAELASLPWEFLNEGGGSLGFLSASKETPFIRSFDVDEPLEPLDFNPPLRVLAVMANPRADLDLDSEEKKLKEIVDSLEDDIELEIVRNTRTVDLFDRLGDADAQDRPFHVLHYMGHGDFNEEGGGILLLEDGKGGEEPLDHESLEVITKDYKDTLRLVFLNACKTAAQSGEEGVERFTGVATTLIDLGIPAVVAMQFPITNDAAIWFAQTFYQRIAHGEDVDKAVSEGRKRIRFEDKTSLEWATPVLFMRSKDGGLFDPGDVKPIDVPQNGSGGATAEGAGADESAVVEPGGDRGGTAVAEPPVVPEALAGLDYAVWLTEADGLLVLNWRTRDPPGSSDEVVLYKGDPTEPGAGEIRREWAAEFELAGGVHSRQSITRAGPGYYIAYFVDDEPEPAATWTFPD